MRFTVTAVLYAARGILQCEPRTAEHPEKAPVAGPPPDMGQQKLCASACDASTDAEQLFVSLVRRLVKAYSMSSPRTVSAERAEQRLKQSAVIYNIRGDDKVWR